MKNIQTQRNTLRKVFVHGSTAAALALLLGFSCAAPFTAANASTSDASSNSITFTDPQKPIIVKKSHPLFSITMQSNPTTGFLWSLKSFDPALIKPVRRTFHPPIKNSLLGKGGYEEWVFAVKPAGFLVPQTTSIALIYARYSELEGAQISNFRVVTNDY